MRAILPPTGEVDDVAAVYAADHRPPPSGRPWVLLDMVCSIDGAVAIDGHSAGLSSAGDRRVFHALRSLADVVVVGAGTARAERYGAPRSSDDEALARRARGRPPTPELVVVSRSLDFPEDQPFLDQGGPVVVATSARAHTGRRGALTDRDVEVVVVGDDDVEPVALTAMLAARGHAIALCEGGPTLNGVLLAADVVDEICCTISPLAVAGPSGRIVSGADPVTPREFRLDRLLTEASSLFSRWVRA